MPQSIFSHRVRVRVCGILLSSEGILLLKHEGIGSDGFIWSPPGGGIEFGQTMEETLVREFWEETGLKVQVGPYLFTNEYIDLKHHAIEHFFQVEIVGGNLQLGTDPELGPHNQILTDIKFMNDEEIRKTPINSLHNIFRFCENPSTILELRGLFKFQNK